MSTEQITGNTQTYVLKKIAYDWEQQCWKAVREYRNTDPKYGNKLLSEDDKLRLLNLKVWSLRHTLSLQQIFEQLLPFWDSRIKRRTSKISGFGVRIASLTGKVSESILQEYARKISPNGELEKAKRTEDLLKYAYQKHGEFKETSDPFQFEAVYKAQIKAIGKIMAERSKELSNNRERNYRTGPNDPMRA